MIKLFLHILVSRSNKRPFSMPMGNNSSSRFEPVKNPLNGAAVSSEPVCFFHNFF
jgi:hypothetical protein